MEYKNFNAKMELITKFDRNHYRKLKERTGLERFPSWGYSAVRKPEDLPNYEFYRPVDLLHPKVEEVPLHKVVGTTHASYYGLCWNEMLIYLKRDFVRDLDAAYKGFDNSDTEPVSYAKYNDEYFISGGGNHRTCIAKFGYKPTVMALVTEYVFDKELFDSTQYLLRYFVLSDHHPQTYEANNLFLILPERKSHIEFAAYFRSLDPFEGKALLSLVKRRLFKSENTDRIYAKWPESGDPLDMRDFKRFNNRLMALKRNSFAS